MAIAIYAAWEGTGVDCTSSPLEPRPETGANISGEPELHWTVGLLLHNCCSAPHLRASNQVPDPDIHQITSALFAIDRQVEQRSVSEPAFSVQNVTAIDIEIPQPAESI
ncbi:hypothetical protein K3179_03650 [Qipengyuania sp. GH38]|nr:hypothetical protein [Qipengyuania intermedia]